jgi:hypothetical protein
MLDGDLIVEGHTMRQGDYCRAESESLHGKIRTISGCTFIAIASLEDEVIAEAR